MNNPISKGIILPKLNLSEIDILLLCNEEVEVRIIPDEVVFKLDLSLFGSFCHVLMQDSCGVGMCHSIPSSLNCVWDEYLALLQPLPLCAGWCTR